MQDFTRTVSLRTVIKNVKPVDLIKVHISLDMPWIWSRQRKKRITL